MHDSSLCIYFIYFFYSIIVGVHLRVVAWPQGLSWGASLASVQPLHRGLLPDHLMISAMRQEEQIVNLTALQPLRSPLADRRPALKYLLSCAINFAAQEPGDAKEIKNFCSLTYNVTFPLFSKVDVNGKGAHPLFGFLKRAKPGFAEIRIDPGRSPWHRHWTLCAIDSQKSYKPGSRCFFERSSKRFKSPSVIKLRGTGSSLRESER